ncbi:hypothetical protein CROQUDRAFT_654990 [Cronartium quercuum f. sp. fusiforme G11]|uniref:RCC1/BLIP-II protein n=1 Tax=Cronartium quercuum f. sp. fusiforme G11 TaxID=708437 RepID=A0A9P6NQ70_9BASI|nr:hypothetical protein CROQUDRAFT_654990 [Cronartium quercuum f. sp. fusiforme G11]
MPTLTFNHFDSLELFAAGSNSNGQLGLGHTDDVDHFTLAYQSSNPTQILSFAAGGRHSLILIEKLSNSSVTSRTLLGSGDRSNHQLPSCVSCPRPTKGEARESTRFTEISYTELISSIQSIDSALRETLLTAYQPNQVGSSWETSFVVLSPFEKKSPRKDSSVVLTFGSTDFGLRGTCSSSFSISQPSLIDLKGDGRSVISITNLIAGPKHVVAVVYSRNLDSDETSVNLMGWGAARQGQLGDFKDTTQKPVKTLPPTQIPLPFDLPPNPDLVKIGVGKEHTVILCPGHICSLGSHKYAQNVIPGLGLEAQAIVVQCCWNTTFLLKQPLTQTSPTSRILIGFGNNSQAQLGSLDPNISVLEHDLGESGPVRLAVGSEHVLVSDRVDLVYGWGWNEHGNLGLPAPSKSPGPSKEARRVIWSATKGQKLESVFAGCATSFLCVRKSSS